MKVLFLASKQPVNAVAAWASSLLASGASLKHASAWSGAGELGRRQNGVTACNADPFLLGQGATLELHLSQLYGGSGSGGDGLLLVSLEPSRAQSLPRAGVVLLVWQPQVPQDIVQQAVAALPPTCLADAAAVRGLLLVDASPSLTLSVTHKALEGAGLQALARKPTVLAPRTVQAPLAAVAALLQLADALPPTQPAPAQLGLPPLAPGTVRIAVARDDAFGPCFHENLTVLQQAGAQLLFFSPLYDAAIPAGATCLYLSSGPLEPERWQQLAANRPLLAGVRAFCEAGGMVLAEGAGLLYLSRTVDLQEDNGGGAGAHSKHCLLDMAGVLPFKTRLLAEAQAAPVRLLVTSGNPLLPAGARPRGYLSAQASLVMVEERQLASLVSLALTPAGPGKATGAHFSTTYEVTVLRQGQDPDPVTGAGLGEEGEGAVAAPPAPEGYALHNVLASSCLLFLPSEPGLAAHWLRRCACIDAAALAAGMAQQLSGSAAKLHLQAAALGSAACSRAGSRRQSIQDVSALTAAYASSGGVSASGCGSNGSMLAGLGNSHHPHSYHHHHQQQQYHPVAQMGSTLCASGYGAGQLQGGACTEPGGLIGNPARPPSNLCHSSSACGATSGLGLVPPPRRSLCGPMGPSPPPPHDGSLGVGGCMPSRSPNPHAQSPHTSPLPPPHPHGHYNPSSPLGWRDGALSPVGRRDGALSPVAWKDGSRAESPGRVRLGSPASQQQQQRLVCGTQAHGSELSLPAYSAASAAPAQAALRRKLADGDAEDERGTIAASDAPAVVGPESPRWAVGEPARTGAGCCDAPGPARAVCAPRAASAGSFAGYAAAGSSCSLSELSHQRRTNCGRAEEAGAVGYVGWDAGAGPRGPAVGAGAGAAWSPGVVALGAGARHGALMMLGPLGAASAAGHGGGGGVVCCAPGACEALVAMGLANRLAGIGADCDHPQDVCASRRVVVRWVPAEEAPQGAAARGIRVVMPGAAQHGAAAAAGGGGGGGGLGACRRGRASGERSGPRGGRALLVDELALRQEPPSVLVLPDPGELSDAELAQLEQGLSETGLVSASGGPSSPCRVLHVSCRTLVDVMDVMLELGAAVDEPHAASMLLERLQARIRRVMAAAAAASPVRLPAPASCGAGAPAAGLPAAGRCPRVLVLQSLQPLVEPGRWVPEMLALAGASSCLALPGGPDMALNWQDVRERAAPDVLIILTSPGGGAGGAGGAGGGQAHTGGFGPGLQDQLAALAALPGWWCLPAVRVSQVYMLHSSYVVRPGPRLVDGVELLARLLMPGQYSSSRKVPPGAVMRLALAAGQRCRATLLPSYFVPMAFS